MSTKPKRAIGPHPETAGWRRLRQWVDKHNMARLAELVGCTPTGVHSWYWRDNRPNDAMRAKLIDVLGGADDDWRTPEERAETRRLRQERLKRLKDIERGAA